MTETAAVNISQAVDFEMKRIRRALETGDGDKEDLVTYAKEVVSLRYPAPPMFASRHNDETGECEPVEVDPPMIAKLRERMADRASPTNRETQIRAAYEQGWLDSLNEPRPFKVARQAMADRYIDRIRSCLLDKPEAGEERPEPWGIVRKGSDGDVAIFSTKFNSVKARFTAGNALKSGQMLYVHPHSPADTDAAQMQEVALARATAREDLFPAMSSRIKAEREQARRKAFEEAAEIAEGYGPSRPIIHQRPTDIIRGRWEGEQAASANIAAAIRKAGEEGR